MEWMFDIFDKWNIKPLLINKTWVGSFGKNLTYFSLLFKEMWPDIIISVF